MCEALNRETVERLFEALVAGDVALFHRQFREDSVIEFPQSRERIVGGENRRAIYGTFPGRPRVRRILTAGQLAVAEAAVDYGDGVDWRGGFYLRAPRREDRAGDDLLGAAVRGSGDAEALGRANGRMTPLGPCSRGLPTSDLKED